MSSVLPSPGESLKPVLTKVPLNLISSINPSLSKSVTVANKNPFSGTHLAVPKLFSFTATRKWLARYPGLSTMVLFGA